MNIAELYHREPYFIPDYDGAPDQHSHTSNVDEEHPEKYWLIHPYLSFGDYDRSCEVERSNVRLFLEMFGDLPTVYHGSGMFGCEYIAIRADETNEDLLSILSNLDSYPAIDDEDASRMREEMIEERWKDFARWEMPDIFADSLVSMGMTKDMAEELKNSLEDGYLLNLAQELYHGYDNCDMIIIEAGGVVYFDTDRFQAALEAQFTTEPVKPF